MSKPGAVVLAKDIEGTIQMKIDLIKKTLQANGIAVTSQMEDEISLYFKTQQEKYDRELFAKGIPEKLQKLLNYARKKKLKAYCKNLIISEQELVLLVHNCSQIGYTHRSKFIEYVPENRRLTESDRTLMRDKDPKKLISKIRAIFDERKNYMIHLFESDEKWHCFYYTYKDMEPKSWKHGPHLHYVSYLWPEYRKRQVWESFDQRKHNIEGIHIRLEPLPPPPPQANQEFKELAKAFISRYKQL
ncbi:hypothetical protein ACFLUO_06280 [Chloroflexota bacterium]